MSVVPAHIGAVVLQGIHAHTCYLNGDSEAELSALDELERLVDKLTLEELYVALGHLCQAIANHPLKSN